MNATFPSRSMRSRYIYCLISCFFTTEATSSAAVVAIDVGHTLQAPGTSSASGETEFSFNLRQAQKLQQALTTQNISSTLIGADGKIKLLTDRTVAAKQQRLFISVHHDSIQPQYLPRSDHFHGYSIFVSRKNPFPEKSMLCAHEIATALRNIGQTPTLHHAEPIQGENRPLADAYLGIYWFDDLIVLKTARQPAVLIEHGVIVNPEEEARLKQPSTQNQLANAVAEGISHCLPKL